MAPEAKQVGVGSRGAVPRHLVVLHGLGAGDQAGVAYLGGRLRLQQPHGFIDQAFHPSALLSPGILL